VQAAAIRQPQRREKEEQQDQEKREKEKQRCRAVGIVEHANGWLCRCL